MNLGTWTWKFYKELRLLPANPFLDPNVSTWKLFASTSKLSNHTYLYLFTYSWSRATWYFFVTALQFSKHLRMMHCNSYTCLWQKGVLVLRERNLNCKNIATYNKRSAEEAWMYTRRRPEFPGWNTVIMIMINKTIHWKKANSIVEAKAGKNVCDNGCDCLMINNYNQSHLHQATEWSLLMFTHDVD